MIWVPLALVALGLGLTLATFGHLRRAASAPAPVTVRALAWVGFVAALIPSILVVIALGREEADSWIALALPALVSAAPLLARSSARQGVLAATAGTLVAGFALLGGFSIGHLYLPSAALLLAAAAAGLLRPRPDHLTTS